MSSQFLGLPLAPPSVPTQADLPSPGSPGQIFIAADSGTIYGWSTTNHAWEAAGGGGGGGANTTLSNLTSPTGINESLLFETTQDIGSPDTYPVAASGVLGDITYVFNNAANFPPQGINSPLPPPVYPSNGNGMTIMYIPGGTQGSEVVSYGSQGELVVQIQSGVSMASDIINALDNAAIAQVTYSITGTDQAQVINSVRLSGGTDTYAGAGGNVYLDGSISIVDSAATASVNVSGSTSQGFTFYAAVPGVGGNNLEVELNAAGSFSVTVTEGTYPYIKITIAAPSNATQDTVFADMLQSATLLEHLVPQFNYSYTGQNWINSSAGPFPLTGGTNTSLLGQQLYLSSPTSASFSLTNTSAGGASFGVASSPGGTLDFISYSQANENTGSGSFSNPLLSLSSLTGNATFQGNIGLVSPTTSTSATSGSASTLPLTPKGYLVITIAGIPCKFPYYGA